MVASVAWLSTVVAVRIERIALPLAGKSDDPLSGVPFRPSNDTDRRSIDGRVVNPEWHFHPPADTTRHRTMLSLTKPRAIASGPKFFFAGSHFSPIARQPERNAIHSVAPHHAHSRFRSHVSLRLVSLVISFGVMIVP